MADDKLEDDDVYDYGACNCCDGNGYVVICIDDMCRGAGECMHGDGEIVCPECHGEGII